MDYICSNCRCRDDKWCSAYNCKCPWKVEACELFKVDDFTLGYNHPIKKTVTFNFNAIPSGDGEAFTFAVLKEDYERIKRITDYYLAENNYHKDRYDLYPDDLFNMAFPNAENDKEFNVEITITEK